MASVKEIEEYFQLGACKSDLSEFRPTRILPRYEILFCKGGFQVYFVTDILTEVKGLGETGATAMRRDRPERREDCWQCFCNVAEKRFGLFLQCG